ncbi:DUF5683 domain-containing protein [Chitinophagaceae bacterium LWZ2-11]
MQLFRIILLLLFVTTMVNSLSAQTAKDTLAATSLFGTVKDTTSKVKRITVLKTDTATSVPNAAKSRTPLPTKILDTTVIKKKHDPHKATIRSAIIPGWGQAYNREYWKIPIVWGAIAIPTYTFFFNNSYYKKTAYAYNAVYAATYNGDSTMLKNIDPSVKDKSGNPLSLTSYQTYRNAYRRDRDYSVLWFVILWGVNVIDATVFAHLKDFDVSSDLSMHVSPNYNPLTKSPSLNVTLNLKNPPKPQPTSIVGR